jgi:hypothetical protein
VEGTQADVKKPATNTEDAKVVHKRILLAIAVLCAPAMFGKVTYVTNGVLSNGDPFSAEADFTMGSNFIQLTVTNLIVNPKDITQNIDGISFALPETFASNVASVSSFTGTDRTAIKLNTAGGWTDSSDTTNNWALTNTGSIFNLTATNNLGTKFSIVGGPSTSNNEYTQANDTIKGINFHDDFLAVTATWTFNVPGVTAVDETALSNVNFSFGTTSSVQILGWDPPNDTPEPFSLALVGSGLIFLALRYKLRH